MVHNSENRAARAMPSQASVAPRAIAAVEIDLAYDTAADQIRGIGLDDFRDKFVAGNSHEAVVSALQLQVCITDSGAKHTEQRKAGRTDWQGSLFDFDAAVFQADRDHEPPV